MLVPGVSRVTCEFDDTGTNEITVPTGTKDFSPEYTCILQRKTNAQVVVGLYDGNDADAPALDAARTSYFFATPTTYERRTIEVWDKFESEAPSRKALVSSSFRSVSYVDRIQLTSLSRCESYVNTASIYVAGTNVTPPAPTPPPTPLDDDAEDVDSDQKTDFLMEFARERSARRLAALDLAARKFPPARIDLAGGTLREQELSALVIDDRRRDFDARCIG